LNSPLQRRPFLRLRNCSVSRIETPMNKRHGLRGTFSIAFVVILIGCDAWKDYTLDPKYSGQKTDD